jgi:hypothetical protein
MDDEKVYLNLLRPLTSKHRHFWPAVLQSLCTIPTDKNHLICIQADLSDLKQLYQVTAENFLAEMRHRAEEIATTQ